PIPPATAIEHADNRVAGAFDSRQRSEAVQHFPVEHCSALGVVTVQSRIDRESDHVIRSKSWFDIVQIGQAANEQTRSDQENKREAHLRHHQSLANARMAAAAEDTRSLTL